MLQNIKHVHVCFLALEHMCVFEEHTVLREPPSIIVSVQHDQESLLALQAEGKTECRQAHAGVPVCSLCP